MYHVIYDRKTPRHDWQVMGAYEGERPHPALANMASRARTWAANRPGWEQYQQGTKPSATLPLVCEGTMPATLPRQTKLEPYTSYALGQELK